MADATAKTGAGRFEVRVTADSHFGWVRTRLSLERTLMSWMRTATALIGFGFAIFQYLDRLEEAPGAKSPYLPHAPAFLGLALIGAGVLGLLLSIWQYRWALHYLWSGSFASIAGMKEEEMQSAAQVIAILALGIGLFAFLAVLYRLA